MKKACLIVGTRTYNHKKDKVEDYLINNCCAKMIYSYTKAMKYDELEIVYVIDCEANKYSKTEFDRRYCKNQIIDLNVLKKQVDRKFPNGDVPKNLKVTNKLILTNIDSLEDITKLYAKDGKLVYLRKEDYINFVFQFLGIKKGFITKGEKVMKINITRKPEKYFVCKICNSYTPEGKRADKEVTCIPINICMNCARLKNINISYNVVASIATNDDEYVI